MAKKIKFPLEMAQGKLVRGLEGFRTYFDLERAVAYFCNGKLQKWLENTYNDDILMGLETLTGQEGDFVERFTDILGVDHTGGETVDVHALIKNTVLKERLKRFYTEKEAEGLVDITAETQEDLERLIKEGHKQIYLLSGTFQIPDTVRETTFKGIDSPTVRFGRIDREKIQAQGLSLSDVLLADEQSRELMAQQQEEWADLMLRLLTLDTLKQSLERV